jgi:hypothetical protein
MSRKPEVEALVSALVGHWTGEGDGEYPTIDPFRYRETLEITPRPDHPALHYEQRTWRQTPDGEVVSHWETGFLRLFSNGDVRIINAQGGRSEVMEGTWENTDDGWTILLEGSQYAGDERVLRSLRHFRFDGETLNYEMRMETTSTNEMSLHLTASLRRHSL